MSFGPDAENLLLTARLSVLEQLLPQLPEGLHYQARMIANAMVIAAREIKQGQAAAAEQGRVIQGLLQDAGCAQPDKALSAAIRRGDFDQPGARQEQLLSGLSKIVRADLAISKPKAVLPPAR
ncbi:DUF6285 domain-containing protein [Pseudomonas putida]